MQITRETEPAYSYSARKRIREGERENERVGYREFQCGSKPGVKPYDDDSREAFHVGILVCLFFIDLHNSSAYNVKY